MKYPTLHSTGQSFARLVCLVVVLAPYSWTAHAHEGLALLIGCTKYDNLDASLHLHGSAHDVELIAEMLCQRFGFASDRVVKLSENSSENDKRPIRSCIEREFRQLAENAKSGQQIVIFMAGHGSQQPDTNSSPDDPEPDGLDEIFLPADVSNWNGEIASIPNCIVDDEIALWLNAIEQKGAFVTMIIDACHSGTMTRGMGERTRELQPSALGIPAELMLRAKLSASRSSEQVRQENTAQNSPGESLCDRSATIAIYAAQSTEVTVEKELPAEGPDRKPHGLLSYTLNQVLTRCDEPISYRELVHRVQLQYIAWGRSFPTPMIEGLGRDREVFGANIWNHKPPIRLSKKPQGLVVDAGILHGIANDCILEVRDSQLRDSRETGAELPLGYVRVQMARTLTSDVVPCAFESVPTKEDLPEGGLCRVVFNDVGDLKLKVAVTGKEVGQVAALRKAIDEASRHVQSVIRLVDQVADADWIAVINEQGVVLSPAEALINVLEQNERPQQSFGPRNCSKENFGWVVESFECIGRANNLMRLAVIESPNSNNLQVPRIAIEIKSDAHGNNPLSVDERLSFADSEQLTIVVQNPCPFAVDTTLLYIDQNFEVSVLYPDQGEINRLDSSQQRIIQAHVQTDRTAIEHLVAITVKGVGPVQDFALLAQPGVKGQDKSRDVESPLARLVGKALGSGAKTRGLRRPSSPQHSLQMYTWEVRK
jgi:hypothetical protein